MHSLSSEVLLSFAFMLPAQNSYIDDICTICVLYKSSAVAEMGDRLATIDMGRKWGGTAMGGAGPSLGHLLTQCALDRGLPLYQMAS